MNKIILFIFLFTGAMASADGASPAPSQCTGTVVLAQGYDESFPGIHRAIDNLRALCQDGQLTNVACQPLQMMDSDIQENTACAGICTH